MGCSTIAAAAILHRNEKMTTEKPMMRTFSALGIITAKVPPSLVAEYVSDTCRRFAY